MTSWRGVSVVVPVYGDGSALAELASRTDAVLRGVPEDWELIFVNDGSVGRAWEKIREMAAFSRHVRGIDLVRNFGQHNALLAGIRASRGDVVVTMDDDLQHPPEEIPLLLRDVREGADLVYGTPREQAHK